MVLPGQWDRKGEGLGPRGGQSLCSESVPESSIALLVCVSSSTFPSGTSVLTLNLYPQAKVDTGIQCRQHPKGNL